MKIKSIIEENEFRKGMYLLLSRIYGWEPDRKLLEDISEALKSTAMDEDQDVFGWGNLHVYFKSFSLDKDCLDQLCVEFAELFLGVGKNPVHPYESVYTQKDCLVMGASVTEVRKIYHRNGFVKTSSFKEPDDHLSVEFEFMAMLSHKMNINLTNYNFRDAAINWSEQKYFFNRHIAKWLTDFCTELIEYTGNSFYAAISEITKEFFNYESNKLSSNLKILEQLYFR